MNISKPCCPSDPAYDLSAPSRCSCVKVVMRQALPFEVKMIEHNAVTLKAIEDSYTGRVYNAPSVDALFDEASR